MGSLPQWFVRSNDAAALILALTANFTLFHLIHRRTPDFLRPYAQILRIHCATDTGCIVMLFLIEPQVYTFNHRLHYVTVGVWEARSPAEVMQQISIFISLAVFTPALMVSIDFLFRWLLICHNYRMSNRQLAAYALSVCTFSLLIGYPYYLSITRTDPRDITTQEAAYYRRMLHTESLPLMGVVIMNEFRCIFLMCVFDAAVCIEYTFIGYIVRRIIQTTAQEMHRSVDPAAIILTNRHITRIMILQAAIPLITCVPVALIVATSLAGLDWPNFGAACSLMLSWLAVLRPVATITIIPHYRNCVLRFLGIGSADKGLSTSSGSNPVRT